MKSQRKLQFHFLETTSGSRPLSAQSHEPQTLALDFGVLTARPKKPTTSRRHCSYHDISDHEHPCIAACAVLHRTLSCSRVHQKGLFSLASPKTYPPNSSISKSQSPKTKNRQCRRQQRMTDLERSLEGSGTQGHTDAMIDMKLEYGFFEVLVFGTLRFRVFE